ncbi:MAG: glycosyltransferase [Pseudomonadota bacterium]
MKVAIIAPFFDRLNVEQSVWIDNYVTAEGYDFHHVPRETPMPKWHDRKSKLTDPKEWLRYLGQARAAFGLKPDVIVTVFPQPAASAGLLRRFSPKTQVLAWMFNVGTCHGGLRQVAAKAALRHIDRFVVHTRREIKIYAEWLNLPEEKFIFVPYQSAEIEVLAEEDTENPFIAAMGSAHRDYKMLADVLQELQIPTTIASSQAALEGIELPDCVSAPFGISKQECLEITQKARVNVIPLLPKPAVTAAGQVTLVEAMFMGKVMVATEYYGVEDYLQHEKTGLLVKPHDRDGFRDAILRLWEDQGLREELAANAQAYARANFSDAAAAAALDRHLQSLR